MLNKEAIILELKRVYPAFIDYVMGLDRNAFLSAKEGKWSAGQQFEHIRLSIKPLGMALGLPKFIPRLLFGKPRNASRERDSVVSTYQSRLQAGAKATKEYIPKAVPFEQREKIKAGIEKAFQAMIKGLNSYSEEQLDQYLLPHPILGKLTIREMMYFTIYHVGHHEKSIRDGLKD